MQQVDLEKLSWNTTTVAINDLIDYPHNPRSMSKKDFDKLVRSLKEDSYHQRIMVDTMNVIIGGHSRRRALLAAGYRPSDLIEVLKASRPLSEDEFKRLNIRDNLSFGDYDFEMLANHFEMDELIDWGMDATLFPNIEPEIEICPDEDALVELNDKEPPKTVLGDVYILGNHRLMCGDSVRIDDIDKLMNGEKPDMIYTDPPYGIDINLDKNYAKCKSLSPSNHVVHRKEYEKIENDTTTLVAKDSFDLITNLYDCDIVYWGANYFTDFLPPAKCWITWYKKEDMAENSFCGAELAYTNSKKHSVVVPVKWSGMYREGESNHEPRTHPTQKPIKLALDIFKYLDAGNLILDLFGGSGTTMIAAEKSNRKCYMMELSPHYCDVIVNRWEKLTGQKAELCNKG